MPEKRSPVIGRGANATSHGKIIGTCYIPIRIRGGVWFSAVETRLLREGARGTSFGDRSSDFGGGHG